MRKPAKAAGLSRKNAQNIAIQALSFVASDPDRLGQFLAATGIGPADIRAAAQEPLFLAGVLDHLASDDRLLQAFAEAAGLHPSDIVRSRETLAGRPWEHQEP